MSRLLVHVEGQTEESFVNDLLAPYLHAQAGYWFVRAVGLGSAPTRSGRFGGRAWASAKKGILWDLRNDPALTVTTMVDFYALRQDWPAKPTARHAREIEAGMHRDIVEAMGPDFNPRRFIPFVMMHEFEALLFSNPDLLGSVLKVDPGLLWEIRNQFPSPEEINDSVHTAPSKRIEGIQQRYEKVDDGIVCATAIGLLTMQDQCPHFAEWVRRLEARGQM